MKNCDVDVHMWKIASLRADVCAELVSTSEGSDQAASEEDIGAANGKMAQIRQGVRKPMSCSLMVHV